METPDSIQDIIKYTDPIPQTDVFKVCILNENGTIRRMIVFQGSDNPITKEDAIFSEDEKRQYHTGAFEIQPSTFQLHPDDSIHILKMKILHELSIDTLSYAELYLFSTKSVTLHLHELYMEVTHNDTIALTKSIVGQLLRNLRIYDIDTLTYFADHKQNTYTYAEFVHGFTKHIHNVRLSVPIGHRFAISRELLFSANPYNVLYTKQLAFQQSVKNPLMKFDNHLLLSYGNLADNTIYVCFADDVLKYGEDNSIASDYLINLYFPLLAKLEIQTSTDLFENRTELINHTKKIMKPTLFQKYKNTDLFYDIYNKRKRELPYTRHGIEKFHLVLHPVSKTRFPLDIVFKQIHTTENIPYIKYNPGHRREPLYRLYSVKRTKNGKKIPELSRSQILSYSKISGKPKQLSIVLYYLHKKVREHMFLHIDIDGDITLKGTCQNTISVTDLNRLLIEIVNPILTNMNKILESSGYNINMFHNVYDERIEFINLKYTCSIARISSINSTEVTTLLSNMFHIYEADINKGAILRFNRVENYKEMNAMNALITQVYKTTNDLRQVKQSIMENFTITEEEANEHVTKYLNDHIIINGNYVNKSIDIAENPGFPCLMRISTAYAAPEIIVEIVEINSIHYIDIIHRYIDVFLRVTQYEEQSIMGKGKLMKMLSKTKNVKDTLIEDNVITTKQQIQPFAITTDIAVEAEI